MGGSRNQNHQRLESAGTLTKPRNPRTKNYFDQIITNNNMMETVQALDKDNKNYLVLPTVRYGAHPCNPLKQSYSTYKHTHHLNKD